MCWEHDFDNFVEFIFHPQLALDWTRAYAELWPTFGELFTNATSTGTALLPSSTSWTRTTVIASGT